MNRTNEARLLLELYSLRREPLLREARIWYATEFEPASAAEVIELMRRGHDESAPYRMVTTYWEMAASFVTHGAIDPQMFHDANSEYLAVYAKLEPFLTDVRAAFGLPRYLAQLRSVATSAPGAAEYLPKIRRLLKGWGEARKRNGSAVARS